MERFQVEGMTCGHCVRAVTEAVRALDSGAEIAVDLATGRVEVMSAARRANIARAIEAEGYTVAAG